MGIERRVQHLYLVECDDCRVARTEAASRRDAERQGFRFIYKSLADTLPLVFCAECLEKRRKAVRAEASR